MNHGFQQNCGQIDFLKSRFGVKPRVLLCVNRVYSYLHKLTSMKHLFSSIAILIWTCAAIAQPEIVSWQINADGANGQFWNNGQLTDNGVSCDVQLVQFSDDNVYITSTGVPRYATAPFGDGNPSQASETAYLFRIPRQPEQGPAGGTATGLGHTAVLINGVPTFNALDAFSYNNQDIWHQNGGFFELAGFDCAKGHPAMGRYHHHLMPNPFSDSQDVINPVCAEYPSDGLLTIDPSNHSPIIGYAFDGYPIYGPYAFDNEDGSGEIVRMESSYAVRDILVRHELADGTLLNPNQFGPDVGALVTPAIPPGAQPVEAVLGAYIEDFEFIENSGHLDVHNGRFSITPEYPNGTYAYFATVDENWNPAFPYFFASYYGVVATDNFGQGPPGQGGSATNVTINETVETYDSTSSLGQPKPNESGNWFPNPATREISWQGEHIPVECHLFDAQGRLVSRWSQNLGNTWSLGHLSPGMYFISSEGAARSPLWIIK